MNQSLPIRIIILSIIVSCAFFLNAQDNSESGLLGDHFSLENALEVFKDSKSLEDFEKAINNEKNNVHNLDLNGDNDIDYIVVNDYLDGDVHAIALSALITKSEMQDIAVIEIERTGDEDATLQIVGDTDLYGENMIVEPFDIEASDDGKGPSADVAVHRIVVNVWFWPSVRYVYAPGYVVYNSPWRWASYPVWWRPWRPRTWSVWSPLRITYAPRYRITPVRRVRTAHVVYAPKRRVSNTVTVRHKTSVTKARTTKRVNNKTTVAASSAGGKKAVASKSTRRVKGADGSVKKASKTKVKATNGKKTVKGSKKTKVKKSAKGNKKGVKKTKKTVKKKKG